MNQELAGWDWGKIEMKVVSIDVGFSEMGLLCNVWLGHNGSKGLRKVMGQLGMYGRAQVSKAGIH